MSALESYGEERRRKLSWVEPEYVIAESAPMFAPTSTASESERLGFADQTVPLEDLQVRTRVPSIPLNVYQDPGWTEGLPVDGLCPDDAQHHRVLNLRHLSGGSTSPSPQRLAKYDVRYVPERLPDGALEEERRATSYASSPAQRYSLPPGTPASRVSGSPPLSYATPFSPPRAAGEPRHPELAGRRSSRASAISHSGGERSPPSPQHLAKYDPRYVPDPSEPSESQHGEDRRRLSSHPRSELSYATPQKTAASWQAASMSPPHSFYSPQSGASSPRKCSSAAAAAAAGESERLPRVPLSAYQSPGWRAGSPADGFVDDPRQVSRTRLLAAISGKASPSPQRLARFESRFVGEAAGAAERVPVARLARGQPADGFVDDPRQVSRTRLLAAISGKASPSPQRLARFESRFVGEAAGAAERVPVARLARGQPADGFVDDPRQVSRTRLLAAISGKASPSPQRLARFESRFVPPPSDQLLEH
ncbi:hypothetical protein DIPPA_06769 [Diplonema papillatum]|nr:hypothetical protein DIPPA_06769 [Diplonema papillatum]